MPRIILSIGEGGSAQQVGAALDGLHQQIPIARLLMGPGGVTGSHVALWARRDSGGCVIEGWPGDWEIRAHRRPPAAGIDRVRAVLLDALALRPAVLVWGLVPAFWEGRRVRAWDVPQGVVIAEARRLGFWGWGLLDDGLCRFGSDATLAACAAESPAISAMRSSSSSTNAARSPTPTTGSGAEGRTIPSTPPSTTGAI